MTALEIKRSVKAQEWAEKVQACRSSGLSVREWCRENGVSSTTYYKWERALLARVQKEERGTAMPAQMEFAELPAIKGPEYAKGLIASLQIGKASLNLYGGVDAKVVKALVEGMHRAK